jgi:hypothetical protein
VIRPIRRSAVNGSSARCGQRRRARTVEAEAHSEERTR